MEYTTLLIDMDGTIYDFEAAEKAALIEVFKERGIPHDETMIKAYSAINKSLWEAFERKEVGLAELKIVRFTRFFESAGLPGNDGEEVAKAYGEALSRQHQLFEGVREYLEVLKRDYRLVIISNGVTKTQYARLRDAGIIDLFDTICISEEMGVSKPSVLYFDKVFEMIEEKDRSRCLVIGDSLTSDIAGAMNYGLDYVWINKDGQKADREIVHEIRAFTDLGEVL